MALWQTMCFCVRLNNLTRAIPPLPLRLITLVPPHCCLEEGNKERRGVGGGWISGSTSGERGYRLMVRMRRAGGEKIEARAAQRNGEWREDWLEGGGRGGERLQ